MPRLKRPTICLITDLTKAGGASKMVALVALATAHGVNMVRLRLPADEPLETAALITRAARVNKALVVADDVDTARAVRADGVHFKSADGRIADSSTLLKGISAHSPQEVIKARMAQADYVLVGTVFASSSHPKLKPGGVTLLRDCLMVAQSLPVLAIGGINTNNLEQIAALGIAGIAVIGAIIEVTDPAQEACRLMHGLVKCGANSSQ